MTPLGAAATRSLDATFRRLTGRDRGEGAVLHVKGRDIRVPQAASGVARFRFAELCEAPLAAGDYIAIARAFHTVVIDDIPAIRTEQRDVARRMILLVDTLYDHRVNLVASAAAEPAGLYRATAGEVAARLQAHGLAADRDAVGGLSSARRTALRSPPTRIAGESLAPEHQSG